MEKKKELLVVTGATGGLGRSVCHYFAQLAMDNENVHPVFCCRNAQKGECLCNEIYNMGLPRERSSLLLADLASEAGVESLVQQIGDLQLPVRYLVNNAASMFASYQLSKDGFEMNMAVNFYAPALLAEKVIPHLAEGASLVNVLSVTRNGHSIGPDFMVGEEKDFSRLNNYSKSKLALSVFTADMAERHPEFSINGVDPGVMNTSMLRMEKWYDSLADILFRPFTRKPEDSLPAIIHACENDDKVSGHIFTSRKHFPIEKKIANHPLKGAIREIILKNI